MTPEDAEKKIAETPGIKDPAAFETQADLEGFSLEFRRRSHQQKGSRGPFRAVFGALFCVLMLAAVVIVVKTFRQHDAPAPMLGDGAIPSAGVLDRTGSDVPVPVPAELPGDPVVPAAGPPPVLADRQELADEPALIEPPEDDELPAAALVTAGKEIRKISRISPPPGYFEQLASLGDSDAQVDVARKYLRGDGVEQSYTRAFDWYQKAAVAGNTAGLRGLGWLYNAGKGVKKDLVQSFYYYMQAAEKNDASAQRAVGAMYENGQGVAKDLRQAAWWYEKAAHQGLARAQTNLAILYDTGNGVERDADKAFFWQQKAAAQGYGRGQTYLGRMYELGSGTTADFDKARELYLLAARQGYGRGQYYLGLLYENGTGVAKDLQQAGFWYQKAVESRYLPALKRLQALAGAGNE